MNGLHVDRGSDGVVYIAGRLDAKCGGDLEARTVATLGNEDPVIVDLRSLASWDTIGICAFLRLARRVEPRAVVLRSPPPNLANVLSLVGLSDFAICGGGRTSEWTIRVRRRGQQSRTAGPDAVGLMAACRTAVESSIRTSRRLAIVSGELRRTSLGLWQEATILRRQSAEIRSRC